MNDGTFNTPPARFRWIGPGWLFVGFALGLAGLSYLSWTTALTDYHPNFVRFHPPISPETNYYPTLNEMTAIVRARCRPDQVLVIVGGNSILLGVWQPPADLWSRHLQELLGDRYCVINFAFRGASPTDGGAIVAEVLRREFPRQVYITNESPFNEVLPLGHDPYSYLFWQAYFSGRLLGSQVRDRAIAAYNREREHHRIFLEAAAGEWFDCVLHYRDFWNRVCFEDFCTVPSYLGEYFPALLKPRRLFPDTEPDAYDPALMSRKYPAQYLDAEMAIVRKFTSVFYVKGPNGKWRSTPRKRMELLLNRMEAFPRPLVSRTLVLVSRNSPFYRRQLTPDEQVREDMGYRDGVMLWRKAGYPSMEYGRDFTDDDFGDRTHLSKTGGRKLAEVVAPEVRAISERLGYFR